MVEQIALEWTAPEPHYYTVGELTTALRGVFAEYFTDIWVAGEISGTKLAPSGHYYFTLKERESQLRCVCFRSTVRFLKFKPQDGVAVVARGRIDVFEARGEYQLLVELLELALPPPPPPEACEKPPCCCEVYARRYYARSARKAIRVAARPPDQRAWRAAQGYSTPRLPQ